MKRKVFLTAFIVMMLLTGCGEKAKSEKRSIVNNQKSEAMYIDPYENIYDDGLIYVNDGNPKRYLDFETMENTVLCSKPNCNHSTSECIAKIVGKTPIIYGDYIYFFSVQDGINETSEGDEFFIKSKLMRVSLTNSEIEKVSEFTDCEPREYDGCIILDGKLYFTGDNMNPTKNEYGGISYANGGGIHYMCSIDLESGKYTNYGSIYDGDKQYEAADYTSSAHVTGYFNSKIYIQYSFMKEYIESTDIESREKFTVLNFEFDPASGEIKLSDLPTGSFIDSTVYVCSNYPEISTTIIDDDKQYTVEGADAKFIGKYANGKLFILSKWYDVSDGSCHSLGEDTKFVTMYNDCYILSNSSMTKFEKLTEEELLALDK